VYKRHSTQLHSVTTTRDTMSAHIAQCQCHYAMTHMMAVPQNTACIMTCCVVTPPHKQLYMYNVETTPTS